MRNISEATEASAAAKRAHEEVLQRHARAAAAECASHRWQRVCRADARMCGALARAQCWSGLRATNSRPSRAHSWRPRDSAVCASWPPRRRITLQCARVRARARTTRLTLGTARLATRLTLGTARLATRLTLGTARLVRAQAAGVAWGAAAILNLMHADGAAAAAAERTRPECVCAAQFSEERDALSARVAALERQCALLEAVVHAVR